ncbi:MAG TPA: MFS transporter [Pseudonocardiaceae bacterium]|nr:MFS transporter [Pseudonocardiaceae bacterium]
MAVAMGKYRRVLTLPGVATLLGLMFAARIPVTATNMVLTLHVVLTLHRSYGSAGLVGAVGTVGIAVGAPLVGRAVDGFGLRKIVVFTTLGYGTYWLTAWLLPYGWLLVMSFVGGVVALPVMSVGRQALAALVPAEHRRTAFSLDSISVEMSFMVGPALGVLIATKVSTPAAVLSVGAMIVAAGIAVYLVNPPVRGEHDEPETDEVRPPRRQWLRAPLLAALTVAAGAVFVLAGTEVAMVAALRQDGQVSWTGVVTIAMCVASAVGGAVYGGLRRAPGTLVLMSLLGLLVVPVGLAGGQWWLLCLALVPSSVMCAPTLTSTADRISQLAPASVRGEAMGLLSSAFTLGAALGFPVVGVVVDHLGPGGGFAAAGVGGILVALVAIPLARRSFVVEPVADPVPVASHR